jgi:hypothetical protein
MGEGNKGEQKRRHLQAIMFYWLFILCPTFLIAVAESDFTAQH